MTLQRQALLFVMLAVATVKLDGGEPFDNAATAPISTHVHAFYYGWFGSPEVDGQYVQWNHAVIDKSGKQFPGGDDIGANFYPQAGCYSANDSKTLDRQMKEMRSAGIGVLVASWWGRDTFTDRNLPKLLDAAGKHGLKVAIHIEPWEGRNAENTRQAIVYLVDRHGQHPAWYLPDELGRRPMFYIYATHWVPARDWAQVLTPQGSQTIRRTKYDSVVIGLWKFPWDGALQLKAGFDGFYTYFGCEGHSFGSTVAQWPKMSKFALKHNLLFIPSVAPGYSDTRIRPWNDEFTRPRKHGEYYDWMFAAALDAPASWVSITSYNEWHEGTQIEPSISKRVGDYAYEDFTPEPPDFYLQRTRVWIDRLDERRGQE